MEAEAEAADCHWKGSIERTLKGCAVPRYVLEQIHAGPLCSSDYGSNVGEFGSVAAYMASTVRVRQNGRLSYHKLQLPLWRKKKEQDPLNTVTPVVKSLDASDFII